MYPETLILSVQAFFFRSGEEFHRANVPKLLQYGEETEISTLKSRRAQYFGVFVQ